MNPQTELTTLLEERARTDYAIQPKLVWIAVASYFTWAALAIVYYLIPLSESDLGAVVGALGLAGFTFSAGTSYLVYLLVNRRNTHFAREEALLQGLTRNLRLGAGSDLRTLFPLEAAEYNLARFSRAGRERSALLWALLALTPYAGWAFLTYVLSFLSQDFVSHEQREDILLEDLNRVEGIRGGQPMTVRGWRIPNPSALLYIVFSVLSLGVFLLAWLYLAIDDPRTHFQHHQTIESILTQPLPPMSTGAETP